MMASKLQTQGYEAIPFSKFSVLNIRLSSSQRSIWQGWQANER